MKTTSKMRFLPKLVVINVLLLFTMSGYAGMFDGFGNYDPYYGRDKTQSPTCYRPCVEKLDRCDCACNVDECKCVRSLTTFERRYADPPYSPMKNYYVNWFAGMF
jgi:hypothetical protein